MLERVECRSLPSVASATLTIVVSRIDIMAPSMATPEMIHTWRGILSAAAAIAAVGEDVVDIDRMVPNH